jgi:hypothetical protein
VANVNGCCRAFYDADDLQAARRWLQKALHLAPAQPILRFNIAAVMQVCTGCSAARDAQWASLLL